MAYDPQEPGVVTALRRGWSQPAVYYAALREFGGPGAVFHDRQLGGHVVVGYAACQQLYRRADDFGRGRLALPAPLLASSASAAAGHLLLQSMCIFRNPTAADYPPRRQDLLARVGHARQAQLQAGVRDAAAAQAARLPWGTPIDLFGSSLRPFATRCANLAVLGVADVPAAVTADALALAFFFDGKRPQPAQMMAAMEAADRLGDWLAARLGLSRRSEPEALADLLLLHVAAHDSLAWLLYTSLVQLAGPARAQGARDRAQLRRLLQEATRYDSPIQMSGRIALHDTGVAHCPIPAGGKVYLHVGAANHDERVFDAPEQFIEGRPSAHLGFGWGPTRCLGAEYALDCATEYLLALQARGCAPRHHAEQDGFDHGLSARGLKAAVFSFHPP